ncbi:uncharacterized protein L3040_008299 [Drepanopeziza brunnea f. sp. 'multigermtubi']|uniref:Chromosome segregation in meiosis protein n=1 Tax=Marssonina brunnea f. sp. multigermtubi (strain MB_m1) TaxID=1072389 RepID=K1WN65_MARBU|nr:replication fork protection component Swi3 [Drepanopeziza brunnea f. sp. 'multigermtubi' MB_m1]EKD14346.1 replication fork protection component Swi3 [Drepanopeziza brunnea f. sp. 'multigermtubi' MB_m1]KAJ5035037.1 hypothetical protein L3040_008299 [Drepanopeziza brunnea f. sp. 'multigermtubi']
MSNSNSGPLPTEGPSAGGGDEFDDLFNYDANVDDSNDPFSENYVVPGAKERQKQKEAQAKLKSKAGDGLGIDDAVEVTRKPREPRIKLDEDRLLSANGIPKLRNRAKKHLRFKGKGHEYKDAENLLTFYQIWLDDLFPKARFLDALAMVEKTGHKKRIQMMRMEWINEGKPQAVHEDSLFDEPTLPSGEKDRRENTVSRVAPIFEKVADGRPKTPTPNANTGPDVNMEEEDLYGATPRAPRQRAVDATGSQDSSFGRNGASIFGPAKTVSAVEDGPDDDELDALMAEAEGNTAGTATINKQPVTTSKAAVDAHMEDDDLDALLAEEEMVQAARTKPASIISKSAALQDDFDDEMEAMAGMDDVW